ncbi:Drug/metabolite transporter [Globisporangium polare]
MKDGIASVSLSPTTYSDEDLAGNGASERSGLMASPVDSKHIGKQQHPTWEWMLGVFFLVVVALIWTFASVLVQYIFHNLSFNGPFFLTYVGITLFSVNLPLWYLSQIVWPRAKAWFQGRPTSGKLSHHELMKRAGRKATYRQIFFISATISPLWFAANFTYNQSLNMTSVTSSTIVSSTSTVFTFLMSVIVLREPFMWLKVIGVVLCMAGNISTIFNDSNSGDGASDHVFGDLVALFSAFMYGVYTTSIRKLIPDEESVSISLFFGFIGVINFVCLLPFVVLFHYSGIESLSGLTLEILGLIGIKGLFDNVLSDYLWARAVLLTSPTVATVGLSLTVPLAILADYVLHQSPPTSVTLLASALVLSGFVLINVSTKNNKHEYHPVATNSEKENGSGGRQNPQDVL